MGVVRGSIPRESIFFNLSISKFSSLIILGYSFSFPPITSALFIRNQYCSRDVMLLIRYVTALRSSARKVPPFGSLRQIQPVHNYNTPYNTEVTELQQRLQRSSLIYSP